MNCGWRKFFFRPYFLYYLSNVHNCGDRFHIRFFNRNSHLRFSYIYSHLIKSKIEFKKYGSTCLPYLKESPLSLLKKIPIFLFWWEHKVSQCMLYCFLCQYGFTSLHLAAQNGDNTLVRAITNHPGVRVDTVTGKAVGWMLSFVQMYANEFRVTYKVTSLRFPPSKPHPKVDVVSKAHWQIFVYLFVHSCIHSILIRLFLFLSSWCSDDLSVRQIWLHWQKGDS